MDNCYFPYDLRDELGEIQKVLWECPGVFFLLCSPCEEFYIVEETAPMISDAVKRMGYRLKSNPQLLAFNIGDISSGQKLVEYEINKFRAINGTPLPDGVTLHSIAIDGMETNPEYFGTYPVPYHTPWGYTLRHKAIDNGVYWIETDQCRRILAVCYSLHDEFSEAARQLAVEERRDREEGLDHTMGYLFFSEKSSCIPIFELMQVKSHWERSGIIKRRALENAIWLYYPEYAIKYNVQETTGQHDFTGRLLNSLGGDVELTGLPEKTIAVSPEDGIQFCTLLEE